MHGGAAAAAAAAALKTQAATHRKRPWPNVARVGVWCRFRSGMQPGQVPTQGGGMDPHGPMGPREIGCGGAMAGGPDFFLPSQADFSTKWAFE